MSVYGGNFNLYNNVKITVFNSSHNIKLQVEKHNKANVALIQGVLRFLRGEYNPTNGDSDTITHNVNGAKLYIPSYISFGDGGLSVTGEGSEIVVVSEPIPTQYYDTSLQRELVSMEFNRLPVSKSEIGTSSGADNGVLSLITYVPAGYYNNTEDYPNKFNTPTYDGVRYLTEVGLFSNVYNGYKSNISKMLARVVFDESPIPVTEEDIMLVQWNLGAVSLDDKVWLQDKGNFGENWV